MRGTSASDSRSTSRSSYLGALALATLLAIGLSAGPAQAQAGDRRAFELFQAGDELYRQGKFAEAAEKFREAYALDPNPTLLYNLARSYESLGDLERAAQSYREFLERQPEASDRPAIERRIQTLDEQIAEREELERAAATKPKPEPVPTPAPDATENAGPGPLPWVLIGVGGAALIGGGVLRFMAESKHTDAEDDPDAMAAVDKQDQAESLAAASGVAFIAGGVLGAVGVSWLLVGGGPSKSAGGHRLRLVAAPGAVSLRGRF